MGVCVPRDVGTGRRFKGEFVKFAWMRPHCWHGGWRAGGKGGDREPPEALGLSRGMGGGLGQVVAVETVGVGFVQETFVF